jgi:hypothetical protein
MSRLDDDGIDRPLAAREDEETLFSRDLDGQLVRLDRPTKDDYEKHATLQIDGRSVTVPLARPLEDAQGNVVLDLQGHTTPRYTTIYDAVTELYVRAPGDESKIPIPTLCHQPHMTPVAVCRLCVVQLYGVKRGKRTKERKLLPACQHQVADGMEVFTMNAPPDEDGTPSADGARVRKAVRVMTELLVADHLKDAPAPAPAKPLAAVNELKHAADRFGLGAPARFADAVFARTASSPSPRPLDDSSPVFIVDRSACILCDRCSREVRRRQAQRRHRPRRQRRDGGDRVRPRRPDARLELRAMRRVHGLLPDERDHLQPGRQGNGEARGRRNDPHRGGDGDRPDAQCAPAEVPAVAGGLVRWWPATLAAHAYPSSNSS